MSKVKARRIGTVDLASAATGLRSSAHASIQSHQRMLECTDAVKKCMVPVEDRSSILNVDVTQMFNISGSSDSDKPYRYRSPWTTAVRPHTTHPSPRTAVSSLVGSSRRIGLQTYCLRRNVQPRCCSFRVRIRWVHNVRWWRRR